eukprot:TRINITY_DN142_c0_g1_i2.p1 TRINITY_DN142_c0_g1~~TRINITY_DN142_c0_g1_i2.p1  ORF type:complete len:133 (+),score=40.74 TRINITY_DN142_c0_g1_i2:84-482(+)
MSGMRKFILILALISICFASEQKEEIEFDEQPGVGHFHIAGGLSNTKPADDEARQVAQANKAAVEAKTGKTYNTFEVESYATQVVAGTNFFLKVKVDNGEYVHVRVYRDLSQAHSVHSVQEGKSSSDALAYF